MLLEHSNQEIPLLAWDKVSGYGRAQIMQGP